MPITVRRINRGDGVQSLEIRFGESTLNVTYTRARYTPKLEREMQAQMEKNLPGATLSQFLINLLTGWDVKNIHEEDEYKAVAYAKSIGKEVEMLTVEELEAQGIRMVDVPITAEILDEILTIEAQSKIVEAIAENQRPNTPSSENTSDTF